MRVTAATVQKCLLGLALLAAVAWNLAHASEIKGLELRDGATGTRADIALDRAADFKVISLKGPDRLVIDLSASSLARGFRLPSASGVVKSVRTGEPSPGTARIVFDLAQPVAVLKPRIEQAGDGPRLVLEWPGDGSTPAPSAPAVATSAPAAPAAPTTDPAAAATPMAQKFDPAASSAATTRLISEIVARNETTPAAPATTAPSAPAPAANVAAATVPPSAMPSVTPMPPAA